MRQHQSSGEDFDIFTVRATDGFGGAVTTAQVRVTVAPTPTAPTVSVTSVSPIRVGESPIGMTVVGNRIYVVNSTANTLSVIDTSTKEVVDTISVPAGSPVAVAATADGRAGVSRLLPDCFGGRHVDGRRSRDHSHPPNPV